MKYVIAACLLILGCTEAEKARYANMGNPAAIKCYSGGQLIYEGESTGAVMSEANSDGYFFGEAGTGKYMQVSGDCIMTYKSKPVEAIGEN